MYHKDANKKQKKATKTDKKNPCFQAINTHFSRYNRNFY